MSETKSDPEPDRLDEALKVAANILKGQGYGRTDFHLQLQSPFIGRALVAAEEIASEEAIEAGEWVRRGMAAWDALFGDGDSDTTKERVS